jgi:mannose/cellobiose epimerase-like protein (N-acyl-D-glucosamine 2-epimerase family)
MSNEMTPQRQNDEMIVKNKEAEALRLFAEIATTDRKATQEEVNQIMYFIPYVLKRKLGCWFSIWTPSDVQEFIDDTQEEKNLTYEQAQAVCNGLDDYDFIHHEITEAIKNEVGLVRRKEETK